MGVGRVSRRWVLVSLCMASAEIWLEMSVSGVRCLVEAHSLIRGNLALRQREPHASFAQLSFDLV
jgi:hypothetical protein